MNVEKLEKWKYIVEALNNGYPTKCETNNVEIVYDSDGSIGFFDKGKFITRGSSPQHHRLAQNVINGHKGKVSEVETGKVKTVTLE